MTVFSDKSNAILALCAWILNFLVVILLFLLGGVIPAVVLFLCATTLMISNYVAINRTITMDASGCKVVLGKYMREYTWDDVSIKRIEPPHVGLRLSYHNGGVFFSIFSVKKPKWIDPAIYCTIFHPFSCFFVYFRNSENKSTPGIYEVDKHNFLEQLDLWGICLDID